MTPVRRCLSQLDEAAAIADSALTERVLEALSELESAYAGPSQRIVALESVLHAFERSPQRGNVALGRILRIAVDRRQILWSRHSGLRGGVAEGTGPRRRIAEAAQAIPV